MSTFSLDTNVVSFYLKGNQVIKDKLVEVDTTGRKVVISPFAWYEVQRGLLASNKYAQMRAFKILCKRYTVPKMHNSLLPLAAGIYSGLHKIGWNIDEMDIFIAAYCLKHNYILVTNNTGHFLPIPDLLLADWTAEQKP